MKLVLLQFAYIQLADISKDFTQLEVLKFTLCLKSNQIMNEQKYYMSRE